MFGHPTHFPVVETPPRVCRRPWPGSWQWKGQEGSDSQRPIRWIRRREAQRPEIGWERPVAGQLLELGWAACPSLGSRGCQRAPRSPTSPRPTYAFSRKHDPCNFHLHGFTFTFFFLLLHFFKMSNINVYFTEVSYNPLTPLLGIYLKKMKILFQKDLSALLCVVHYLQ